MGLTVILHEEAVGHSTAEADFRFSVYVTLFVSGLVYIGDTYDADEWDKLYARTHD